MCLFYLVFGIDEAVVDELLVVAVLTDAVDCRSGVQVLGGGHLAHPLELHPAQLHAEGGHPVDVHLLLVRAAQDVERLVHRLHLLLVVDRLNGDFAKAAERVVIDLKYVVISHFFRAQVFDNTHIVSEEASLVKVHNMSDQEVEDMVTSLTGIS